MAVDEPVPVSASNTNSSILIDPSVKPLETYSSVLSTFSPLPSFSALCTLTAQNNLVIVVPKELN